MTTGNYPPGGTWEIDNGWDVITSDGEKLGDVEEVHPHYLVVGKGLIFHSERYVPVSTITSVDDDKVYLAVSKAEVEQQGWDTIPDTADTTGTTGYTDRSDLVDTAGGANRTNLDRRTTSGTDDIEVPVVEEELDVRKRQTEEGAVHVHKDVVETEKQVTVPVREERIRVERHEVDEQAPGDMDSHTFQEEDIEIPLRGEEVEVSKRPVVREHVHVSKDVEEHDETVSGRVRREDVVVEGEDTIDRGDRP